ncbi:hypothetical protein D3C76_1328040 [compost metagenome]
MQRVTGDARAYHRNQRQPLTQTKLARQARFIEDFQRAVGHFCGVAELQQVTVSVHPHRQRADVGPLQDQVDLFMRLFEIMSGRDEEFDQADIVMAGDDTRPRAGGQHALNTGRALKGTGVKHRGRQTGQLAGFVETQ